MIFILQAITMATFYEFFSGGGMARAGLGDGWQCLFANDFSDKKALSYKTNWGDKHLHIGDINNVTTKQLPSQADMAWASFPCQDLSLAGNGAGLKGARSGTFWAFWNLIKNLNKEGRKPKTIILENVYGALTSNNGNDFQSITKALASENYILGAMLIDAVHFVPQSRPRLFFLAIDKNLIIPSELISDIPLPAWHPEKIISAYNSLPKSVRQAWRWWNLENPTQPTQSLEEIIEKNPLGVEWHTQDTTKKILAMMDPLNRKKVISAQNGLCSKIGTIYKRTRNGVQRAEVRFDGIAGCLRTPSGGSSRQTIMIVDKNSIRSRLLSPREAARLMGLNDNYTLPKKYNDAYHLAGDGVVVPVVKHINKYLLTPILKAQCTIPARRTV